MLKMDLPTYIKLDDDVRPQDDFYVYVCKHWLEDNPLPQTRQHGGLRCQGGRQAVYTARRARQDRIRAQM